MTKCTPLNLCVITWHNSETLHCVCVFCVQDNLEKQTLHAKSLAEKLWLAERQLEELEVDKDTRDKRTSDLNSTILRLETEVQRQFHLTKGKPENVL